MGITNITGTLTKRLRGLGVVAVLGSTLAVVPAAPTHAASASWVDITVSESIPVSGPGEIVADGGLAGFDCLAGEVTTTSVSSRTWRDITRFRGTKDFDCGTGTLSISFSATVRGCASNDFGAWRVIDGSGAFEGARGGGFLVGTYTGGDACTATGIDDRYRGVIRV